ncbi:MAG: Tad domain-containing protein [Bacillota bacterium]|nr:Tad domain-containing protein [Bacillota bacterium]
MSRFFKRFLQNENGNAILFVGIALMGLLGMAGLAIDGGLVYMTKTSLQKTANAAVLSGAQELTNNDDEVSKIVHTILDHDNQSDTLKSLQITSGSKVAVDLTKSVKLSFARLFGFDHMDVTVHSAASLGKLGRAVGAAPLGIDESIPLEFNKIYQLKTDSSGVEAGNFGVLALGGPGASTYEDNLRNGYQEEIKIGDLINTETGNIAGKTRSVVQERINGCPENPRNIFDRNCSRVILVPVYKPYNFTGNQMKQIKITGFAYFYITDPMDPKDTSIKGMFIRRAGLGYYDEASKDKGAYSIRLTE